MAQNPLPRIPFGGAHGSSCSISVAVTHRLLETYLFQLLLSQHCHSLFLVLETQTKAHRRSCFYEGHEVQGHGQELLEPPHLPRTGHIQGLHWEKSKF